MRCPRALLATLLCGTLLAAGPAWAETHLHLGETATVMAAPDELAAAMRIEATSATAAEAQARVNTVMQDALARTKAQPGVTVSTGGYGVWRVGPTPQDRTERWQATQTLNLSSHDDAALLKLVGELQQKGLAVGSLGWRLSREAERRAHQEATKQALTALRGRAEEAAGLLDLRFEQFKDIRLDTAEPQQPLYRAAMPAPMALAAVAPAPSVAPQDVAVTATAEADVVLQPR
ncbi:MAG: SIMPL domain-containing protein [Acetobacteraceae bacterium]|nr:SIMPL domain-containing protein [Acetobacteraceae bacterium]